jgi:hypothetical protein
MSLYEKRDFMKKIVLLLLSLTVVLVGCTKAEEDSEAVISKVPEIIAVTIQTPENIKLNEEVTIQATVTQGNEKVKDANEVAFEVRNTGQDEKEMLEGTHQGDGVYSVKKTFDKEGTYTIVAHVTARDMHHMPSKEVIVGNATDVTENKDHESTKGHGHNHGHSHITIEFNKTEAFTANKETSLSAKIQNEGKPLKGAIITFEVWQADQEKREFIDAIESNEGEYMATHTFLSPGSYEVKVHVKKDEIHEHQQESIEIK